MAKKASIINVTVDAAINTAYVTYDSGSEKLYPADKMPKTVKAWLETHQPAADPEPKEDLVNMNVEAMKHVEEFAQTVLSLPAEVQSKAWDKIGKVLTPEELHTAQLYVGSYHLMTDRSFYNTVRDSLSEQIWNEMHQEPETDPVSAKETMPAVIQAPSTHQKPQKRTEITPVVNIPIEPKKPLLRGFIAMTPYIAAMEFINLLILIVSVLGIIAEIGAAIFEVLTDYKKDAAALANVLIKIATENARAFKLWLSQSIAWRGELVEEWREPEWI